LLFAFAFLPLFCVFLYAAPGTARIWVQGLDFLIAADQVQTVIAPETPATSNKLGLA
jgi:hypothetical protein